MGRPWIRMSKVGCLLVLVLVWGSYAHSEGEHSQTKGSMSPAHPKAPIKITSEELHRRGGVPPGWQFRFPDGDPAAGRAAFAKLECYQCHTIRGEVFPQPTASTSNSGPELTGMGGHHPVEYFAESILNPNAVIITGPGYMDADGLSVMPDYRETLTVAEFIDLLAYLQSLQGDDAHDAQAHREGRDDHGTLLDQVAGDYRIRLIYHEGTAEHQSHQGDAHGGHGAGTSHAKALNHLMVFITDGETGEPVPYLPVSVKITAAKRPPRTVQLKPMMGDQGFHYGADVALPRQTAQLTLSIGPTTMRVMPPAPQRFTKPQQVSLDWTPQTPDSTGAKGHAPQHQGHGGGHGTKGH